MFFNHNIFGLSLTLKCILRYTIIGTLLCYAFQARRIMRFDIKFNHQYEP